MNIRNFYSVRDFINGQTFSEPSLTIPDLSYSIKQLISEYQVGQLPSLSRLQHYFDGDDFDAGDDVVLSADNDLRFEDRADAYFQSLESNKVSKLILEKVRKMREWKRQQQEQNDVVQ